jgi:Family of unknown function (DUF6941)
MPEVLNIFFADAATYSAGGKVAAIGIGLSVFEGPLPLDVDPFSFVVQLAFTAEECGRPHHFALETFAPDGSAYYIKHEDACIVPPPEPEMRCCTTMMLKISGVRFTEYGKYTARFSVDGEALREFRFGVRAAPNAEQVGASTKEALVGVPNG